MKANIFYEKNNINLNYDVINNKFFRKVDNLDVLKFLKGVFTNKERFKSRFLNDFIKIAKSDETFNPILKNMVEVFEKEYDNTKPFTYEEAFKIENDEFRAQVFGSVNITDMIESLGHKRINTQGKKVKHKQFSSSGEFLGFKEYDVIYETHQIPGEKLGLNEDIYALKCWCTTTNDEHWLWIEDQFKDDPLSAVASLCRFHENVIPHIKEIKRQGDILLVEMNEEVEPKGNIRPLTSEEYFNLLTAQS